MSTMSEQSRARAKEKVSRLANAKVGVVDASGWKQEPAEKDDVQTGMRVLSRRAFKKGGKVMGEKAMQRADRKPRAKGGGIVDDYFNVDQKKANDLRDGFKQTGGLKSGGRAKKAGGGPADDDDALSGVHAGGISKPLRDAYGAKPMQSVDNPRYSKVAVDKAIQSSNRSGRKISSGEAARIHRLLKGNYAAGGRTGKLAGGAMGMRPNVMPPAPISRAPAGIRPQTGIRPTTGMRPMMRKDGGKVHKDEAEDKKLIKSEMHKAGCSCAKCSGGKVSKARGGNLSVEDADTGKPTLKLLKTHTGPGGHTTKVYRDQSTGEHRVKYFKPGGVYQPKADSYHDDDKEDAMNTAKSQADKGFKRGGSIDKLEGLRDKGGREARAAGGRTKKGAMNVNIIIAQPQQKPAMPPMGVPPGMPPGGPVGLHQGAPPPQAAAPAPMQPSPQVMPPQMRKAGGRTGYPLESGGGGGLGRLEKIAAYG